MQSAESTAEWPLTPGRRTAEFALDSAGRKSIEASTLQIPERTHVVTLCHCSLLYLYPSQIAMALMKNLLDTSTYVMQYAAVKFKQRHLSVRKDSKPRKPDRPSTFAAMLWLQQLDPGGS